MASPNPAVKAIAELLLDCDRNAGQAADAGRPLRLAFQVFPVPDDYVNPVLLEARSAVRGVVARLMDAQICIDPVWVRVG